MEKSTRREFAVQCGSVAAALSLGQALGSREAAAATDQLEVSIDILGLNALVQDRTSKRTEVLFVDPPSVGLGMPSHKPFLVANLRDVTNPPEDSKPTAVIAVPAVGGGGVQQVGLWDLTDRQVLVRRSGGAEVTDGLTLNAGRGDGLVTAPDNVDDPEAWRDLSYVADIERICGQGAIAPGLSSLDTPAGSAWGTQVPEIVRGRMRFAGGVLEAAIPSQEAHRRTVFQFSRGDGRPALSQPLTDTVRWSLSTDTAIGINYVTLDLVPLRDKGQGTCSLMLSQQGRPCRLSISNMPVEVMGAKPHHAMSVEEMAALHFGAYYKLLRNRPADEPLPRLWVSPAIEKGAGVIGPFMCPPALFTRD